jgi:hypothetical protein
MALEKPAASRSCSATTRAPRAFCAISAPTEPASTGMVCFRAQPGHGVPAGQRAGGDAAGHVAG